MTPTRSEERGKPLLLRLVFINVATVAVLIGVLVLTPVTVSYPVDPLELTWVVLLGVAVLVLNVIVVAANLAPLRRLDAAISGVRSSRFPTVPVTGGGEIRRALVAFNSMSERLRAERERISRAVMEAQEAERRRIGADLHDEVGQDLTYLLLLLSRLEREASAEDARTVRQASDQVRVALGHVRELASDLRPNVLEDLGLASALREVATRAERTGLEVACTLEGLDALEGDQALAVYRIVQEAVTNVLRHAGATRLAVTAAPRAGEVVITVADDGQGGVDPAGHGVTGMGERAAAVRGDLQVESDALGTVVRLTVPAGGRQDPQWARSTS